MNMFNTVLVLITGSALLFININLKTFTTLSQKGRLVCVNEFTKYLSFGNNSQVADLFWVRFLQETDAYNESKISEAHLCMDQVSSWHYHILNISFDLDKKFYEMFAIGPLMLSIIINDIKGSSVLFDKAVVSFPNDWRILYQASYQAMIEEKDYKKAGDLLFRAGQNGAPKWVFSLAGGMFKEAGKMDMANSVYSYLVERFPNDDVTKRLKEKLDNKIKNFYEKK